VDCDAVQSGGQKTATSVLPVMRIPSVSSSILQPPRCIPAIVATDIVGSSGRRLGEAGKAVAGSRGWGRGVADFLLESVRWFGSVLLSGSSGSYLLVAGSVTSRSSYIAMEHDRPSHLRAADAWTVPMSVATLSVFVAVFVILAGPLQPTLTGKNSACVRVCV
jgi:hypothetical protein